MPFPWQPGMVVTAARLEEDKPHVVTQGNDQTATNTVTLRDTNLSVELESGALYVYHLYLAYSAPVVTGNDPVGGLRTSWSPSSVVSDINAFQLARNNTSSSTFSGGGFLPRALAAPVELQTGGAGESQIRALHEVGQFQSSGANTVVLQFAQAFAGGTTTVYGQSWLQYQRIG